MSLRKLGLTINNYYREGNIMSYSKQVREWSKAANAACKRVLASKEQTRKFMQGTKVVSKNGKELAKAYR